MNSIIQLIAVCAIPLIFSITLHEAAHGYAAMRFGDRTAWFAGRVTLNPAKHIDPFGTIILPLIMLAGSAATGAAGFIFGWAKPVPVGPSVRSIPDCPADRIAFRPFATSAPHCAVIGWPLDGTWTKPFTVYEFPFGIGQREDP